MKGEREGWRKVKLNALATVKRGASPRPIQDPKWFSESGPGWVRIEDVTACGLELTETRQKLSDLGVSKSVEIFPGDLIMSISATIGTCTISRIHACIHDGFVVFKNLSSDVDLTYFRHLLAASTANLKGIGQTGTQANINSSMVGNHKVWVPPLQIQKKIACVFDSLDILNKSLSSILALKQTQRSALMQALLTAVSETCPKFRSRSLGELFVERKEHGRPGLPTLSVTMHDGLVDREDHGRRVASDLAPEQHLLAHKDDIVYNMMRMWQGVCGLAPYDGLVSPAYVVLSPLDGIDPLFASYLFKLPETIRLFHRYSQGLTNDRLRLYFEQFAEIKVIIPADVEEQRRIARLLSAFDDQIQQAEAEIEALKQMKAAICQEIFT